MSAATLDYDKPGNSVNNEVAEDVELIRQLSLNQSSATVVTPSLFTNPLPIEDDFETDSSKARKETMRKCLPFLLGEESSQSTGSTPNSFGIPILQKDDHIGFLRDHLADFPAPFVSLDAARPWLLYWSLAGLSFLGEDVSEYRERCVIVLAFQINCFAG